MSSPRPSVKQLLEEQDARCMLSDSDDTDAFLKRRRKGLKRKTPSSAAGHGMESPGADTEGQSRKKLKRNPAPSTKMGIDIGHNSPPIQSAPQSATLVATHRAEITSLLSPKPRAQNCEKQQVPRVSSQKSDAKATGACVPSTDSSANKPKPKPTGPSEQAPTEQDREPVEPSAPAPLKAAKGRRGKSEATLQKEEEKRQRVQARKDAAAKKKADEKAKKEREAQEKRMWPAEYAAYAPEKFKEHLAKASPGSLCFKGLNILFVGSDIYTITESTRKKMDLIIRKGGNLMAKFDPEVTTHIFGFPDSRRHILKALDIDDPRKIPNHIPTLNWTWAVQKQLGRTALYLMHELYAERLEEPIVGSSKRPPREPKTRPPPPPLYGSQQNSSDIEESTSEMFQVYLNRTRKPSSSAKPLDKVEEEPILSMSKAAEVVSDSEGEDQRTSDPLAAFYDEARVLQEEQVPVSDDEAGTDKPVAKSRFQCDKPSKGAPSACPNQDIVDKLEELQGLHSAKPTKEDHWRNFSYGKSIRNIKAHTTRIKSYAEARAIPSVGHKTALKIMEIIETGNLGRIKTETTEDVVTAQLFTTIYGVGPNTAYSWFSMGLRTLKDVEEQKFGIKLSGAQKLGLKYHKDINQRIPREEVRYLYEKVKKVALQLDPKIFIEVMGSYRRGKADCGDIDILLTRPTDDGKTHSGIMRRLLQILHEKDILSHDLSIPEDLDDLETSYRGLCQRERGAIQRRIDILCVPYVCLGGALIYYTGDDIFNRSMRLKASSMGYSLNQRGLSVGIIRDPRNRMKKLDNGTLLKGKSEREIFRMLGVPWQEPHERVRG